MRILTDMISQGKGYGIVYDTSKWTPDSITEEEFYKEIFFRLSEINALYEKYTDDQLRATIHKLRYDYHDRQNSRMDSLFHSYTFLIKYPGQHSTDLINTSNRSDLDKLNLDCIISLNLDTNMITIKYNFTYISLNGKPINYSNVVIPVSDLQEVLKELSTYNPYQNYNPKTMLDLGRYFYKYDIDREWREIREDISSRQKIEIPEYYDMRSQFIYDPESVYAKTILPLDIERRRKFQDETARSYSDETLQRLYEQDYNRRIETSKLYNRLMDDWESLCQEADDLETSEDTSNTILQSELVKYKLLWLASKLGINNYVSEDMASAQLCKIIRRYSQL